MNFKNVFQKVGIVAFSGMMALSFLAPAVHAEGGDDSSEEELTSDMAPEEVKEEVEEEVKESIIEYEPPTIPWYRDTTTEEGSLAQKYEMNIIVNSHNIRDEILRQMVATVQSEPTILRRIYATQYLDVVDYKKLFESVNSESLNHADTLLGNMLQCVLTGEGLVSIDDFFGGVMHRSLVEEGLTRFPEGLKGKILADFDEHYSKASESGKADVVSSFLKIASHERKKLISLTCDLSCSSSH